MIDVFPWRSWSHVVKLDPDKELGDRQLTEIVQSGTDAILVGGTQGITYEKSARLLRRLRMITADLPLWQEISSERAVIPGFDGYGIPVVLNSSRVEWLISRHAEAVKQFGSLIPWERIVVEGYIVLNPEAAVAKQTQAVMPASLDEVKALAVAAERILGMKTLYLEYSGIYGSAELVHEIRKSTNCHLIYGGGINSPERAAEMAVIADTIVVGNAVYEQGAGIVAESVLAVKEIHANKRRVRI